MALGSENQSHSYYQMPYAKPTYQQHQLQQQQQQLPLEQQQQEPLLSDGVSVVRRNARERNRVKQVNNGFSQLRQHIPVAIVADLSNGRRGIGPGANKKLSKVSTLRMAVEYIRRLQGLIDENDSKRTQQQHTQTQQQHFEYLQQQQQQQQQFYALQQQLQLISPSGNSCSSSDSNTSTSLSASCSSSSNNNSNNNNSNYYMTPPTELKLEAEDYRNNSCSSGAEDDDILDYISLWQDDL